MEAKWRVFALIQFSVDVATETSCLAYLLWEQLGFWYGRQCARWHCHPNRSLDPAFAAVWEALDEPFGGSSSLHCLAREESWP